MVDKDKDYRCYMITFIQEHWGLSIRLRLQSVVNGSTGSTLAGMNRRLTENIFNVFPLTTTIILSQ